MADTVDTCWDAFAQSGTIEAYLKYRDCVRTSSAPAEPAGAAEAERGTAASAAGVRKG